MTSDDRYLTCAEAAEISGFTVRGLEAMRHRGIGPPWVRVGQRSIRYSRRDLLRWLSQSGRGDDSQN